MVDEAAGALGEADLSGPVQMEQVCLQGALDLGVDAERVAPLVVVAIATQHKVGARYASSRKSYRVDVDRYTGSSRTSDILVQATTV